MYLFLIPLILGFGLAGASAFTASFSRRWGEKGGQMITMILRNVLGIPLWFLGFILGWWEDSTWLSTPGTGIKGLGWLLMIAGSLPVAWGHLQLGWRTHMPSMQDSLVRDGLYGYVRHPIYAGGFLIFAGLALLKPTFTVVIACGFGIIWLIVQARLEEIDLIQRLPAYREYMKEVPRFFPDLRKKEVLKAK
jgi:protein-S-isoprenylcysteine O-methyltransferase Ste14